MKQDTLTIEILDDGTIKTTTDKVSAANHQNATDFLKTVARMAGGVEKIERRQAKPVSQNQGAKQQA